jgi:hypothetical protein
LKASTARRWASISIFIASAVALLAKPEKSEHILPIDVLLRQYSGSLPPVALIQAAGKKPGAMFTVRALLRSTTDKDQEVWPAAIESLGIITNLGNPEGYHACEDLDTFMHGSASFHGIMTSHDSREWDKRARLAVPLALGHILNNLKSTQASSVERPTSAMHDCSDWHNYRSARVPPIAVEAASAYLLDTLEQVAVVLPAKAQWCRISGETETQDTNCRVELQLNAVDGLRLADSEGAKEILHQVLVKSRDAQVLSLAKSALGSFHAQ